MVRTTGWLKGLRVTADGTGIVLHAGVALIRVAQVAPDNRGRVVLCHQRLGVHGHHRVVVDVHHARASAARLGL